MPGFDRNEAGKLFVGGLSWDTTKESLLEYFSQYGEVIDCVVMKNPDTGKSRGFGFVTYRDTSCVDTVLSVPAHNVDGRQVDPKACNPKGPGGGARGGGDGGGRGNMGGGPMGDMGHNRNRGPNRGGGSGGGQGGQGGDRKMFLGGLPNGVDKEAIMNFFSQYGKVIDVTVMYDAQKQRSRGFGFLTFENEDAVNQLCRDRFVNFNGKKVECKRATPRNTGGGGQAPHDEQPLQQGGMPPHVDMHPPQHPPGPVPGPEPQWSAPEGWTPQMHQSPPPPQIGVPAPFSQSPVQLQPQYQGEVPAGAPPGWPPHPPPHSAGGWPPGAVAGPPQPGVAPGSAHFLNQPTTQAFTSTQQPAPGAPMYQYPGAPPTQQPPGAANGQTLPPGQPAPSSYGYTATSYASPSVTLPPSAGSMASRPFQDYANSQQMQLTTTVSALPGAPAPVSTAVTYSAYPSPYGATLAAGAAPSVPGADPYAQSSLAHQPATVQVGTTGVPPPAGQQAGVPGGYVSPVAQSPVGAGSTDPATPKAVDYSSYYGAYGYTVESSASAAVSPTSYGGQPTPAQAPVPGQAPYASPEAPQGVAYSGAPGPSPTYQRHGSSQQYHPYVRR